MDRDAKLSQVNSLKDEVRQLHPLLNDIFRKLDHVTYVEYTHGANEMGADFVLQRHDATICESYYVGVVVKADRIQQNTLDIERQVKECSVPRLIRGGKEKVRMSEVWVITSQSISRNAKEKVAELFSAQRISFHDADRLVDWIDLHSPFFWYQLPNATGAYLSNLALTIAQLDSQTAIPTSSSASVPYIDLDIEEKDHARYRRNRQAQRSRPVNLLEEVLTHKVSLLEADMGFGKSKTARRIASKLSSPEVFKDKRIVPVFQPFRTFSESEFDSTDKTLKKLVGEQCFDEALRAGAKFLLILDGLDESVLDQDQSEDLLRRVVESTKSSVNTHLLLTSRPFKFIDESIGAASSMKRYAIRPLTTRKLLLLIRQYCDQANLPKRLYEDLARSELFKQLPHNPIAAALLSNLLAQNSQELPSNLTELYSKSLEYMLGRWDTQRQLTTEKLYRACERLARHLAKYMLDNKIIYVSKKEFESMIGSFLQERNIGVTTSDVVSHLLERSNIFGKLDSGTIFFRHRSFAEYLYARDAKATRQLSISTHAFDPYWTNVFFFYFGELAECPDELGQAVNASLIDERWKLLRLLQMGNYLLAGYQSPYSIVEESLHVLFIEAATLYLQVKKGAALIERLGDFSEMKLLWLFSIVVKTGYGYTFFKRGLPLAMAQIDDNALIDSETKAFALFFAACALSELDDPCGFAFLLSRHETEELPLSVSLGIRGEKELGGKLYSKIPELKEHERRLRKILTFDKVQRVTGPRAIEDLFERPVKTADRHRKP